MTLLNLHHYMDSMKEQEEIVNKVTELENQIQERKQLSEKLVFGVIKEKLER